MRILAAALAALLLSLCPSWAAGQLQASECVLCHPSRDPEVFKRLYERPGNSAHYASAGEAVCRTCHNGTVRDDRGRLGPNAFGHPVGMPGKKDAPRKYPLYGDQRMECATCHTPHPDGSNALGRPGWLRADPAEPFPCGDCHRSEMSGVASHQGAKLSQAMAKAISARGGRAGRSGEVVCASCHIVHGATGKSLLIAPYGKEGERTLCRLCHPAGKDLHAHPVNVVVENLPTDKFKLSENGALTCSTCHPPHGVTGTEASLGLRYAIDGNLICEPCHPASQRKFFPHLESKVTKDAEKEVSSLGGRVSREGKVLCLSCHSAHGAPEKGLTVAAFIDGKSLGLCNTCHKAREVKDKVAAGVSQNCTDCHGFHGRPPTVAPDGGDPCLICHKERTGRGEHSYSKGKGCTGCHSIHKGDPKRNLVTRKQEGDQGCRECHNPKEYGHAIGDSPLGVKRDLLVRRSITLDQGSTVGCPSCHASHKASEESLLKVNEEILCLYCHPTQNPFGPYGLKAGAHPVGMDLAGPRYTEAKRGAVADPSPTEAVRAERFGKLYACSTCHRAHRGGRVSQATCEGCHVEVTNRNNHAKDGGCLACHPVHAERSPSVSCEQCHMEKAESIHPRSVQITSGNLPGVIAGKLTEGAGEVACPTCHDPHSKSPAKLRGANTDRLCLSCHPSRERMLTGTHGKLGKGEGRSCATCHPVHDAKSDERAQGERCLACHPRSMRSAVGHTSQGSMGLWSRIERLPLFDTSGRRNIYGFVDCPSCHDLHTGPGENSLRLPIKGTPDLCLSCHQEKRSILGTPHDTTQGKAGEDAPCSLCHTIHSQGKMPPTWAISSGAVGSLNDRKCSPCHGPPDQGPKPHQGPGSHPSNVLLPENMEARGLKLYSSTGDAGGRTITCSTCHNIHGELSTTDEVTDHFLRLNSDDGTLCSTCHTKEAAVRATAHDISDGTGRERPLGPCSPCHVAHRGDAVGKLWGVKPFGEGIPQNSRCKSCHSRKTEGDTATPRLYQHMRDAEVAKNRRNAIILQRPQSLSNETAFRKNEVPVIPVFDAKGLETDYGVLACISCHDPHQWSPENPMIKPSPTAKWTVTTSFLKFGDFKQLGPTLCSECHKKDTEDYFTKYHEIWSDPGIENH